MVNNNRIFSNTNKISKHKHKCYNCDITGHSSNECRRPKSQVNVVNQGKGYVCYFSETANNIRSLSDSKNKWLLDS